MPNTLKRVSSALIPLLLSASSFAVEPAAGRRVVADFAPGREPTHKPGSLNFRTNSYRQSPLVFRTVLDLPDRVRYVPVRIQADRWLYVWVNGRCIFETGGRGAKVTFPVELDLNADAALKEGPNILCISAPKEGFALAGWLMSEDSATPLASDPKDWRVWKFPPLTILRDQALVCRAKLSADTPTAACKAGDGAAVTCGRGPARVIADREEIREVSRWCDDYLHACRLLRRRGIVVWADAAGGWGGPGNVPPEAIAAAERIEAECLAIRKALEGQAAVPEELRTGLARAIMHQALLRQMVWLGRRLTNARLLSGHLKVAREEVASAGDHWRKAAASLPAERHPVAETANLELHSAGLDLDDATSALEKAFGGPLNALDSAVANKAGWIDDPSLMDAIPAAWGVRVNPVDVSWRMDLAGKWRLKLDPKNTGLAERVHEFGYNIANQWPEVMVPGIWERQGARFQVVNPDAIKQSPFPGVNVRTDKPYNGFAWYRKKVLVPAEWAGYDLELYLGAVDDWDWAYWNGQQVGHTGAKSNPKDWWKVARRYAIPKSKVTFGGYNVIAVRVYDCGDGGGILGGMELRCPALKESFERRAAAKAKSRKPTEIFSGPLSPAALLTVGERRLEMFGWDLRSSAGPDGMLLNLGGRCVYRKFPPPPGKGERAHRAYDRAADGRLGANWVLLWARPGRADGELPIQLIFLAEPRSITVARSQTGTRRVLVDFGKGGRQVLALRPVRPDAKPSGPTDPHVVGICGFWSSAALAQPVHYAELAKLSDGRTDRLDVVDVYDYRMLADAWGTKPVKIAPLPPLACYGLSVRARDLTTTAEPLTLTLGDMGRLHAAVGAGAVRYTVPLDRAPRLAGFTSYCFSGADVGVPGNHKELELMAWTGCNSWRPQSNDSTRRIVDTVKWTNAAGMNCMLNIDNALGAKPAGVAHWVKLAKAFAGLKPWQVAFDLINEPANMAPKPYNAQVRRMVSAIRKVNPAVPLYVETPHSFASIDQFPNLDPVDDPHVIYTFHDYDYRLKPRWPTMTADSRNMAHQWLPAMTYSLKHDAPICISEYGGFEQTPHDPFGNPATLVLLNDFFRIFDQFGWHHHYYANRGLARVRADGSVRLSLVHEAYRRYSASKRLARFRRSWQAVTKSR